MRAIQFSILCLLLMLYSALDALPSESAVDYAREKTTSREISQFLAGMRLATEKELRQAPEEPPRFFVGADGYLRHLGAPPSYYFPVAAIEPGEPEKTARNFLRQHARLFGIISPAVDLRVLRTKTRNDREHVRFEQTYAGIPVFGAQIAVRLNNLGGVECVASDIARDIWMLDEGRLSLTPVISAESAVAKVRRLFAGKEVDVEIQTTTPRLAIFAPSVVDVPGCIRLIWDMKVYIEEPALVHERILIDAHSAEVVMRYSLDEYAMDRVICDARNTDSDPGTEERVEGDGESGIPDVDDAYDFLGDTYNFYSRYHQRDGIDGAGQLRLEATVRYCRPGDACPWPNAQWDPDSLRMYFGMGYAVDDVVGHEYTHGVTDYESDLEDSGQANAIEESFSDIWGEIIDQNNDGGDDSGEVKWLIGEDLPGGALRNMRDPTDYRDPDRMGSRFWYDGPDDNTFAHTNCGVGNKLAFLLCDGETFNGHVVEGVGWQQVITLFYEVQTGGLLPSWADYFDLYNALIQAAWDLGWSPDDMLDLHSACDAVEISVPVVYVDGEFEFDCPIGFPFADGTVTLPFSTVADGLDAVRSGGVLAIKGGSYDEAVTFSKRISIMAWDGTVVIGR